MVRVRVRVRVRAESVLLLTQQLNSPSRCAYPSLASRRILSVRLR